MQAVKTIVAGAVALGSTLAVAAAALAQSKEGAPTDVVIEDGAGQGEDGRARNGARR